MRERRNQGEVEKIEGGQKSSLHYSETSREKKLENDDSEDRILTREFDDLEEGDHEPWEHEEQMIPPMEDQSGAVISWRPGKHEDLEECGSKTKLQRRDDDGGEVTQQKRDGLDQSEGPNLPTGLMDQTSRLSTGMNGLNTGLVDQTQIIEENDWTLEKGEKSIAGTNSIITQPIKANIGELEPRPNLCKRARGIVSTNHPPPPEPPDSVPSAKSSCNTVNPSPLPEPPGASHCKEAEPKSNWYDLMEQETMASSTKKSTTSRKLKAFHRSDGKGEESHVSDKKGEKTDRAQRIEERDKLMGRGLENPPFRMGPNPNRPALVTRVNSPNDPSYKGGPDVDMPMATQSQNAASSVSQPIPTGTRADSTAARSGVGAIGNTRRGGASYWRLNDEEWQDKIEVYRKFAYVSQTAWRQAASPLATFMEVVKAVAKKELTAHGSVAIRVYQKSYSYIQLISSARKISNLLCGSDIKKKNLGGARVGIVAKPSAEFIAGILGTWFSGGVAVPLALSYPKAELLYVISNSDVSPILSRTTGKPGVVHTHKSIPTQARSLTKAWGYTSADQFLHCLPLHHASAKELMRMNGTTKSFVDNHLAESVAGAVIIWAFEEEDLVIVVDHAWNPSILVIGCVCISRLTNGVSQEMKLRAELISQLEARPLCFKQWDPGGGFLELLQDTSQALHLGDKVNLLGGSIVRPPTVTMVYVRRNRKGSRGIETLDNEYNVSEGQNGDLGCNNLSYVARGWKAREKRLGGKDIRKEMGREKGIRR